MHQISVHLLLNILLYYSLTRARNIYRFSSFGVLNKNIEQQRVGFLVLDGREA